MEHYTEIHKDLRFLCMDPSVCATPEPGQAPHMIRHNKQNTTEYIQNFFCSVTDPTQLIFLPYIEM
jgi:hypothetical protein